MTRHNLFSSLVVCIQYKNNIMVFFSDFEKLVKYISHDVLQIKWTSFYDLQFIIVVYRI